MLQAFGIFICSVGVGLRQVVKVVFWLGLVLTEVINPLFAFHRFLLNPSSGIPQTMDSANTDSTPGLPNKCFPF